MKTMLHGLFLEVHEKMKALDGIGFLTILVIELSRFGLEMATQQSHY